MKAKFKKYLEERQETPYEFAKRSRIAWNTVQRALDEQPIYERTALKFIRHTKGYLKISDFKLATNWQAKVDK